jgi:hypothetical protein
LSITTSADKAASERDTMHARRLVEANVIYAVAAKV